MNINVLEDLVLDRSLIGLLEECYEKVKNATHYAPEDEPFMDFKFDYEDDLCAIRGDITIKYGLDDEGDVAWCDVICYEVRECLFEDWCCDVINVPFPYDRFNKLIDNPVIDINADEKRLSRINELYGNEK